MPSYAVTGASRGIGLGFIRALSQADSKNVIFGLVRNISTAKEALELATKNPNVHILQADITDNIVLKDAANKVFEITGGSLDVLINNAAYLTSEYNYILPSEFASPEVLAQDLHKHIDVNVLAVMNTIDVFLPLLKASSVKKVVSISSAMSDLDTVRSVGAAHGVSYAISKGALNVAMAKYAAKFKDEGITFLSICPGFVDTDANKLENPSPEELAILMKMVENAKKLKPDFDGMKSVEYSVNKQLEVINHWTLDQSGAFVSHKGNNKEWF